MIFSIDNIVINISEEANGLRLTTEVGNRLLRNQTYEETKSVVETNYKIVKDHFRDKIDSVISETDLENMSLKIVLHYFYMYNLWRTMYKREKNRDLKFIQKDFEHPSTSYQIIDYFKNRYPADYAHKCETLLNMTADQFLEYDKRKDQFDNK